MSVKGLTVILVSLQVSESSAGGALGSLGSGGFAKHHWSRLSGASLTQEQRG